MVPAIFEGFIKVGNMLKSGLLGDELYGFPAVHEHFLGFANSYHLQVLAKVKACQLGEHSAEIGRADVKLLGDLLQRKPFMIIGFDILGNLRNFLVHRMLIFMGLGLKRGLDPMKADEQLVHPRANQ